MRGQVDQQHRCSTPRPHPFVPEAGEAQDRRIAMVARGLDDVVASFMVLEDEGLQGDAREFWSFVVASRRLWVLALRLYRTRSRRT